MRRQETRAASQGDAAFQPPRLIALGRLTDLTRDFVTPGSGDFMMTGGS